MRAVARFVVRGYSRMSSILSRALASLILGVAFSGSACERAAAEVLLVPAKGPAAAPTLTMFWEGTGARALLILIPGGEGQLHLKPQQLDVGKQFYQTLKQLSLGPNPKEILDVVLFDSPEP